MLTNQQQHNKLTPTPNVARSAIEQRPIYKTVEQFSNDNSAFTPSALRNLIFKADERHTSKGIIEGNGLLEAGAIIRIGRKILINENCFYAWVELQNREVQR